jgi:hypothetical protein
MVETRLPPPAPYQPEESLRDRARQAIATGDQAAARALLHQLFVDETPSELSASLTEAVVATASAADRDAEARALPANPARTERLSRMAGHR